MVARLGEESSDTFLTRRDAPRSPMSASAARHSGPTAIRQEAIALSYAGLERPTTLIAVLLRSGGIEPRVASGSCCQTLPTPESGTTGTLRRRSDRADEHAAEGARRGYQMADSGARVLFSWHQSAQTAEPERTTRTRSWLSRGKFDTC
jgi:hypothetical protein